MSLSLIEACKKRKRSSKFYGLHTFGDPGCPISLSGPFRDNIRKFVQQCTELEDYNVEGNPIYSTFLVHENKGFVVPLYTIEETSKHSLRPFCDQCRCTGWSHHFVSKRKYHLIIPMDDEWNKPLNDGVFDLQTHLLHGLIHCNGFGHLLCINGIEGGSKYLCGREIMDLWDRICTNLHTRKITVGDVSRKKMMDLRLLHGVAYGHPWFGRWGYRFCHGSFGVTEHKYERAINTLSSIELDTIIQEFRSTNEWRNLKQIICGYRDLSETHLITVRDLLRFMLALKSRAPRKQSVFSTLPSSSRIVTTTTVQKNRPEVNEKSGKYKKFPTVAAKLDSRWPVRRLEYTANVIVDALKEKRAQNGVNNCGMTRQEARDAARLHIGDTGLIDYVLKSMNNVIFGGYIVYRSVNPSTRVLEYSIEEAGSGLVQAESETEIVVVTESVESTQKPITLPGADVYGDVLYLYDNVLLDYPDSEIVEFSAQTVLDTKHFVKEWPFRDEADELLRFIFRVRPCFTDLDTELRRGNLPGEYIVVPLHATIRELKSAVEIAMRETYCIMERLRVTDIEEFNDLGDDEVLFGVVESGTEMWAWAQGMDLESELKYEGGSDNWMVRCKCGARDDDGERMVACDICGIWQHTRCSGIEDDEAVPPLFVCHGCCASLVPSGNGLGLEYEAFGPSSSTIMNSWDEAFDGGAQSLGWLVRT